MSTYQLPVRVGHHVFNSPSTGIARPRLYTALDRAIGDARIVLLAGAPGSGKTHLVRSWLEARPRDERVIWPTHEAYADAKPDALVGPVLVVVDDADRLPAAPLRDWLRSLPAETTTLLIAQGDVQADLHHHRLAGDLVQIGDVDLAFTLDEVRELLNVWDVQLPDDRIADVHAHSKGWAAGLVLSEPAFRANSFGDPAANRISGCDPALAEYFRAEVLGRQALPVRDLLLRTSLLEPVIPALANAATGRQDAEPVLRRLADARSFVVADRDGPSSFRYHPLFAEFLRGELQATEPASISSLHALYAGLFQARGDHVDALKHAIEAGPIASPSDYLAVAYFTLTFQGDLERAHALLDWYPTNKRTIDPALDLVIGHDQLLYGSTECAADHFALARRHEDAVPLATRYDFEQVLSFGEAAVARQRGDLAEVLQRTNSTREVLVAAHRHHVRVRDDARIVGLLNRGVAEFWDGDVSDARAMIEQGAGLARRLDRPYLEVGLVAYQALITTASSLVQAQSIAQRSLDQARAWDWGASEVVAPALLAQAATHIFRGHADLGDRLLQRALQLIEPEREPVLLSLAECLSAELALLSGQLAVALERFDSALAVARDRTRSVGAVDRALEGRWRCQLWAGDGDSVADQLAGLDAIALRRPAATLARAELAVTAGGGADDELDSLVEGTARIDLQVRALLIRARRFAHDGDADGADAALARALEVGERDGLLAPFLAPQAQGILGQYTDRREPQPSLIRTLRQIGRHDQRVVLGTGANGVPEALTAVELAVIRLLPSSLTNRDIANEMFVTTNTIKTHLKHIYAKLGVHARAEAVVRARGLGLLSSAKSPSKSPSKS